MCNDYGNRIPYSVYVEEFSHLRLPLILPTSAPNLEPRDDIWPTEVAPVIRRHDGRHRAYADALGICLRPDQRRRRSSISAPKDGGSHRDVALMPASHFFEFNGTKSPKSKWRFTKTGEDWFCFAGLWRPAQGDHPESFTLLTTEPGPDVAPIHNREVVVLERIDWQPWLDLTRPESDLLATAAQRQFERRAGALRGQTGCRPAGRARRPRSNSAMPFRPCGLDP